MKRLLNLLAGSMLAMALVWVPVQLAFGAQFILPDDTGNVTVSADSTIHNAYVIGSSTLVNGTTTGDLYIAGGSVTVEGSVEGDIVAVGGNVYINGVVGGDVRALGGTIIINNTVGGDVVMAGGEVSLTDRAVVAGDVAVAGGVMTISGPIAGKLSVTGGVISVNSAVEGPVYIKADEKLSIGERAVFGDEAVYKSWQEAEVADGAQTGGLRYEQVARSSDGAAGLAKVLTLGFIFKLLAMILAALILIKLFPRKSHQLVAHLQTHPWSNLGIGFAFFIVAPILAILLLVSMVGFYAGFIVFMLWLVWAAVATLIGMVAVGAWLNGKLTKKSEVVVDWQAVVVGVVVMAAITLIPVIGWLIMLAILLAGFGTILRHVAQIIREQQAPAAPTEIIN